MPPLATDADVAARLLRSLSEPEKAAAKQSIETTTGLIADVAGQTVAWVESLDPARPVLKGLCVERALAALENPANLSSESETLGAHTTARTYRRGSDGSGMALSEVEERIASRAIFGTTAGSGSTRSVLDPLINLREGREADEDAP